MCGHDEGRNHRIHLQRCSTGATGLLEAHFGVLRDWEHGKWVASVERSGQSSDRMVRLQLLSGSGREGSALNPVQVSRGKFFHS
eukprot:3392227-Rhodomonas_salina.2